MFTRNLQVMISAGIALPQALRTLSLQAKNKKLKKTLLEIVESVIKGESFSKSLARHPNVFSELFCSMVMVGEESGTLDENLAILTRQMERDYELKSRIQGALMYPAVIVAAMLGIGVMMLVAVVPRLAATFKDLGIELPLTTKIVIGLGTFLSEKWYVAILILVVLFFVFQIILKMKDVKKRIDAIALRLPIISPIIKKNNAAYTIRTLSSLITAGVSLVRSLEIIMGTTKNFYFKQALIEAVKRVKRGERLSVALRPYQNIYPISVIQMIEVGEETGETSRVLDKLGNFFEEEVNRATKNLVSIIEPILMLLVGGVVGFFAVSMIQPMYSMLGGIK
jgi:type IV pilus assembly protein PilC